MNYTEYDNMWNRFQAGHITETQWIEFCNKIFLQVLEENKDVFIRLKNRD